MLAHVNPAWLIAAILLVAVLLRTWWVRRHYVAVSSSAIDWNDGDTIYYASSGRRSVKIRCSGFDAPEMDQAHGRAARDFLRDRINAAGGISLLPREVDRFGRIVADVRLGMDGKGGDLASLMIRSGWAHSYQERAIDRFIGTLPARILGRGLWKNSLFGLRVTRPSTHRYKKAYWG